jgi:hypothetical protein
VKGSPPALSGQVFSLRIRFQRKDPRFFLIGKDFSVAPPLAERLQLRLCLPLAEMLAQPLERLLRLAFTLTPLVVVPTKVPWCSAQIAVTAIPVLTGLR